MIPIVYKVKMRLELATAFLTLILAVAAQEEPLVPSVVMVTSSGIFNVREQRALYCKGFNLPEPLNWYNPRGEKQADRSSRSLRVFVERSPRDNLTMALTPVMIQSVALEDNGNWTCRSGNMSDYITLTVGEKVNITEKYVAAEGHEGSSIKLECNTRGTPRPDVQWYKNDVKVDEKNRAKYSVRRKEISTELEIKNLEHSDAATYVCNILQSTLGHFVDKTFQLSVLHKPLVFNETTKTAMEYETMRMVDVYAVLNETKNLTCSIVANPPPKYTWKTSNKGFDENIPEEDNVFTAEDGSSSVLVLRMRDASLFGKYKCRADNGRGVTTLIFHVSEGRKPVPPDYVSLVNASVDSFAFNVSCSGCTLGALSNVAIDPYNLPIIGYSFQFAPVKEEFVVPDWEEATEIEVPVESSDDTIFLVGPLPNSTTFHVRVRSKNSASFSEWVLLNEHPSTTDFAVMLGASAISLIAGVLISFGFNKV